jgi:hypothetical protein
LGFYQYLQTAADPTAAEAERSAVLAPLPLDQQPPSFAATLQTRDH